MKPNKAYILKTDHEKSIQYAADVAKSCDAVGLQWEYFEWFQGKAEQAWAATGVDRPKKISGSQAAQCCFSGHIALWKKIADSDEPAIVLEHDGMMLHPVNIDVPDNFIVVLGYKLANPKMYDHVRAGPPQEVIATTENGHEGSHAYTITPKTADMLIKEVIKNGAAGAIDNRYFLKSRKSEIGIKIMSPTPAVGWVRDSTIQGAGKSSTRNYSFIKSFVKYYDDKSKVPAPQGWEDIISNDLKAGACSVS